MKIYYAEWRLQGVMVHEPFGMPLTYVLGLKPWRVKDESGRNAVSDYRVTKYGRTLLG